MGYARASPFSSRPITGSLSDSHLSASWIGTYLGSSTAGIPSFGGPPEKISVKGTLRLEKSVLHCVLSNLARRSSSSVATVVVGVGDGWEEAGRGELVGSGAWVGAAGAAAVGDGAAGSVGSDCTGATVGVSASAEPQAIEIATTALAITANDRGRPSDLRIRPTWSYLPRLAVTEKVAISDAQT